MTKRYNTTQEIKAEVVRLLQERLELINVDQDKYMLDGVEDDEKQVVTVIYDGIKMMTVRPSYRMLWRMESFKSEACSA